MSVALKRDQFISLASVLGLAIVLPGVLKLANSTVRSFVGAEGRLAAISVETNRVLGPLPAPWRALAQGGEDLQNFLTPNIEKVGNISPEYIRIDHIYDQFDVVGRSGNELTFDWTKLDKTVNDIVKTGAMPFFSLSYMPMAITSGDITSEPKDWNDWSTVVQKTIEHYSGQLNMANVYYEVWNEPDLFGGWKMGGKKDYKTLYSYAATGAARAQVRQQFKFGGPATTGLYQNWIDQFFPFILQNNLRLDFFSWHRYDADIFKYTEDVQNVQSWIDRHPNFAHVEKVISEMGADPKKGGLNDTKAGAAHLVSVMRELAFNIKYGFTFSVTGSWGIIGSPRYTALQYLDNLGPERLSVSGEGSWVRAMGAKKGNTYQVILANYDPKGVHSEVVPVTFMNLSSNNFVLKKSGLGIASSEEKVATTAAYLQAEVPMTPNSVVMVELIPSK